GTDRFPRVRWNGSRAKESVAHPIEELLGALAVVLGDQPRHGRQVLETLRHRLPGQVIGFIADQDQRAPFLVTRNRPVGEHQALLAEPLTTARRRDAFAALDLLLVPI